MEQEQKRVLLYLNRKKPWMTYSIIIVTVAVYLLEMLLGADEDIYMLVMMGAKYNPLIEAGQYWRLLTSALLHANPCLAPGDFRAGVCIYIPED